MSLEELANASNRSGPPGESKQTRSAIGQPKSSIDDVNHGLADPPSPEYLTKPW